ncbi:MAG TPA: hypothetical protein PLW37_11785 [bacterium]|jgi:hypothetical protein|nr:hypothetical protein [bacterium]MDX9806211.1 hypothetical protein [bacterium]HNZ54641.1 hypothetical protein [bacterium]HOB72484.1 hypothetical protein [bacterium]HPG36600.1 hypothetical protein [bacterium]
MNQIFKILTVFVFSFVIFSCGTEDEESESVTDNETSDKSEISDDLETSDDSTENEIETDNEEVADNENSNAVCGNSTIEDGESCDGGTVSCEALGSQYGYGIAPCKSDCTGFDTSDCPLKSDGAKPYGKMTINFKTDFIFDYDTADSQGDSYFDAHPEGIMTTPAFTGLFGYGKNAQIPFEGSSGDTADVVAYHWDDGEIYVVQHMFSGQSVSAPRILLIVNDSMKKGDILAMCPDKSFLQVIQLTNSGSIDCLVGFALDETLPQLSVDEATDITAKDGGKLYLSGSDIIIYHPTDTPDGDLSQQFISQGAKICPVVE